MKPFVKESFSLSDIDRIIQMAWHDRTSRHATRNQAIFVQIVAGTSEWQEDKTRRPTRI